MTNSVIQMRNLVIAAESLGGAEAALACCRAILEVFRARPTGLIIEPDAAALQIGPGHRLVSSSGALIAFPSQNRLRRIAKADADQFRRRLSSVASEMKTDWACELKTGELVSAACAKIGEADILVLGQRPMQARRGKVLLLEAEGGASEASHSLAQTMARGVSTAVLPLRAERQTEPAALVDLVDRHYASAVVVDLGDGPFRSEDDLRQLFAAARCPLAVLGAGRLRHDKGEDAQE
ncbi:hypothetical protein [Sagittula salina]|uniref:Uncharacterized protein n=1 Tax=Sagittula salina TaxID=2820268 RepID=A0A940RZE4_9RHOB|nr:hypothetical protein [Sagittula salina]MBP0480902.1 hypothetical protein [Sagittula salina]